MDDEEDSSLPPFRDGKVHVLSDKCKTCIFRPGNLMHLRAGRVKDMVETSISQEAAITCHSTLKHPETPRAICRGFFDSYSNEVFPLRLAKALNAIEYQDEPEDD